MTTDLDAGEYAAHLPDILESGTRTHQSRPASEEHIRGRGPGVVVDDLAQPQDQAVEFRGHHSEGHTADGQRAWAIKPSAVLADRSGRYTPDEKRLAAQVVGAAGGRKVRRGPPRQGDDAQETQAGRSRAGGPGQAAARQDAGVRCAPPAGSAPDQEPNPEPAPASEVSGSPEMGNAGHGKETWRIWGQGRPLRTPTYNKGSKSNLRNVRPMFSTLVGLTSRWAAAARGERSESLAGAPGLSLNSALILSR